jgi:hypothetical protein
VRVAGSYNSILLARDGVSCHSAQPVQKLAATPEMLNVSRRSQKKNDVLGFGLEEEIGATLLQAHISL